MQMNRGCDNCEFNPRPGQMGRPSICKVCKPDELNCWKPKGWIDTIEFDTATPSLFYLASQPYKGRTGP